MDSLTLDAIELMTRIGVTDQERNTPQKILVTLELFLDLTPAGKSDDISDSVDYAGIARDIQALATVEHRTIEAFAHATATLALKKREVASVRVTVQKFPPIGARSVWATIVRFQ